MKQQPRVLGDERTPGDIDGVDVGGAYREETIEGTGKECHRMAAVGNGAAECSVRVTPKMAVQRGTSSAPHAAYSRTITEQSIATALRAG